MSGVAERSSVLSGRLADPTLTLGTDPRGDPRIGGALAPFFLDRHLAPPLVTADSPRAEQLAFCAGVEAELQAVLAALTDPLPTVAGITRETVSGPTTVFVHRPSRHAGPLPVVVHLHGGAMSMLRAADPVYARWRDELAATGLVVVG
ncbi:MAG TPA: hypothetical protein VG223_01660, partial [Solirubrobacteraceae bacterium]|nr:hypothetical protein [Solirubrobacteraceae bacterium]